MGYNRQEIEDSLSQVRYDDVFATYLLLGRKSTDVSITTSDSVKVIIIYESRYFLKVVSSGIKKKKILNIIQYFPILKPESDGSRSGSSLSLRNIAGNDVATGSGGGTSAVQSPTHRGVHRSISASSTKPSRRASSGAETLREY